MMTCNAFKRKKHFFLAKKQSITLDLQLNHHQLSKLEFTSQSFLWHHNHFYHRH